MRPFSPRSLSSLSPLSPCHALSLSLTLFFSPSRALPLSLSAGGLAVGLSALAVVVYGASVSSTYPWQALQVGGP